MDYLGAVQFLRQAEERHVPESEVRAALTECLCSAGIVRRTLHPGYSVVRVRRNAGTEVFSTVSELSYRPSGPDGPLQRANTKNSSLFYSASCERRGDYPNLRSITDNAFGLNVALFETLPELKGKFTLGPSSFKPGQPRKEFFVRRGPDFEGARATYGLWEVTDDVALASVCPTTMYGGNFIEQHMQQHMLFSWISADPVNRIGLDDFWYYLAATFSTGRTSESDHQGYAVSAIAAEIICALGFDGVAYPSMRSDSAALNVAITPRAVDSRLCCKEVGLVRVSTRAGEVLVEHERHLQLGASSREFDLRSPLHSDDPDWAV